MPNLPWVEAIKARVEKESIISESTPLTAVASSLYIAHVSHLLRAVEVLGEAVEYISEYGDGTSAAHEAAHHRAVARRALADVREG